MIALVFITVKPNKKWLKFIQTLKRSNYDLFVAIDPDDNEIVTYQVPYKKNIHYINYSRDECEYNGYNHCLAPHHVNRPSAWDKALYYFCEKNTSYDYVWFIEDDVFIPNKYTVYNIDKKKRNHNSHLLCCGNNNGSLSYQTKDEIMKTWWGWCLAEGKIEKPWENSMVCACRLSKKLLSLIKNYVSQHHTLIYHEFMFNTLALHNHLKISYPVELSGIIWRYDWKITEINKKTLYHPFKSIDQQNEFRKLLHQQ